ncbi:hypothetical protein Dxin01_03896 [Deinococcus xinjiangensis]|uniref:Uncharacterized protein n=1 Tax=Deinococcus xinjiangensis TaxID=457454 RepID=A0ABP9VKC5_9DEIO
MRTLDDLAIPTLEAMLKLIQQPHDADAVNDLTALIREARPDLTPEQARFYAEREAKMLAIKEVQA